MKQYMHVSWLALAALACASLLWPAAATAVQKQKKKVYQVPAGDGLKIESKLDANDDKDKKRTASFCKVYLVKMSKDKKYVIRMNAADMKEIDAYLRVENAAGKELAFNDDAPGESTLNSRIDFTCPADGVYRIYATSLNFNATGDFTFLVKLDE